MWLLWDQPCFKTTAHDATCIFLFLKHQPQQLQCQQVCNLLFSNGTASSSCWLCSVMEEEEEEETRQMDLASNTYWCSCSCSCSSDFDVFDSAWTSILSIQKWSFGFSEEFWGWVFFVVLLFVCFLWTEEQRNTQVSRGGSCSFSIQSVITIFLCSPKHKGRKEGKEGSVVRGPYWRWWVPFLPEESCKDHFLAIFCSLMFMFCILVLAWSCIMMMLMMQLLFFSSVVWLKNAVWLVFGSRVLMYCGVWAGGILFAACCWAMFTRHMSVSRSWRGRSQNWSTCAFGANTGIIYSIPSIFCADDI